MALDSMKEIFEKMEEGKKPFWQVVLDTDVEERQVTAEASFEKMRTNWRAMLEAVDTYRGERRSVSGLVGGDGARMRDYAAKGTSLSGDYLTEVIATALSVGESNACMCKIVAAPTAGACGVLSAAWWAVTAPGWRSIGKVGRPCPETISVRSSRRRCAPVSPTPACGRSWRRLQRGPAAC